MRINYAEALCQADGATLDDVREGVETIDDTERIARRVLGDAHPFTVTVRNCRRNADVVLAAHETRSA